MSQEFVLIPFQVCDLEEKIVNSVQDTLKLIELGNKLRWALCMVKIKLNHFISLLMYLALLC